MSESLPSAEKNAGQKRTVSVVATCSFDFEIDDEAVSEWDGAKILEVLDQRGKGNGIYTEDATLQGLLGSLGIMLCVENRRMGSFDGWADFSESAASGSPYGVEWDIEDVTVSARVTPPARPETTP